MITPAADLKKMLKAVASKDDLLLDSKLGQIVSVSADLTIVARSGNFVSRTPFNVSVSGKQLGAVVNRMSGDINIQLVDGALVLKSARATVKLETKVAKAFNPPPLKDVITLPLPELKPLLTYALNSVSKNVAESFGGVIRLADKAGSLRAAGTDGARLAISEIPYTGSPVDLLIPVGAVTAISNLEGYTVDVVIAENYLFFGAGDVKIYAGRLAKEFVAYESFLPKTFAAKYEVDSEALKNSLLTVKPLIGDEGEPGISVHFLDNVLVVEDFHRAATDSVDYLQLDPEPTFEPVSATVRLNVDHLLSFFGNITGPATISVNGPKSPIWLEAGNKKMLLAVLAG